MRGLPCFVLALSLIPALARAQTEGCEPDTVGCVRAPIAYRWREGLPVEFDFDTDWVPRGSPVQIRIRTALAGHTAVNAAGELVASWPEPMLLRTVGTPGAGSLEVDYGVVFDARIRLSLEVEGRSIGWEGRIPYTPMIDFRAMARTTFDPWAWDRVSVTGRTMRQHIAEVSITDAIVRIPGISGGFNFDASGEVAADYRSTRFTFGTAADPITAMSQRTLGNFTAGPFVDYAPRLEGALNYHGTVHIYPGLYVRLAGRRWNLDLVDLPIPIGPFPRDVRFDPAMAHLGLPDIQGETATIDFGELEVGRRTERSTEIRNMGESDGRILRAQVDAPFEVTTREGTLPVRSRTSFVVGFSPVRPGPVESDLVVTTNDPDNPRVRVHLRGVGVAGITPPPPVEDAGFVEDVATDASPPPGASQDGSCGCHPVGARNARTGLFAMVALLSAASTARRRRPRRD